MTDFSGFWHISVSCWSRLAPTISPKSLELPQNSYLLAQKFVSVLVCFIVWLALEGLLEGLFEEDLGKARERS